MLFVLRQDFTLETRLASNWWQTSCLSSAGPRGGTATPSKSLIRIWILKPHQWLDALLNSNQLLYLVLWLSLEASHGFVIPGIGFTEMFGSLSSVVFLRSDTSLYQRRSSQGLTMVSSPPPPPLPSSAQRLKYQVDRGLGHKYSKPVISACKTELIDNIHSWLFSSTRQTLGSLHRDRDT